MSEAIVITPVKNSIENTLRAIEAIHKSQVSVEHFVFNDFSTDETKEKLEKHKSEFQYKLVHLEDMTDTPSPNYDIVLQTAQKKSLDANVPLIVIESDVVIRPDTLGDMLQFYKNNTNIGMLAAITVDENDKVNFPYLRFRNQYTKGKEYIVTKKSLSFCCTLISTKLLKAYDFAELDRSKDWFDTFLSSKSVALGFQNILLNNVCVLHHPHGSRPWKQLKYTNPVKYYFQKFIKRRDKI